MLQTKKISNPETHCYLNQTERKLEGFLKLTLQFTRSYFPSLFVEMGVYGGHDCAVSNLR